MKQHYKLVLVPKEGSKPIQKMGFRGTLWQANRAFQGLRVALHSSEFKHLQLVLVGKNEMCYQLNSVDLTGADYGL